MTRILFGLIVLQMLSGCGSNPVLLDRKIPHRLADDVSVTVWARDTDGKLVKVRAQLPADRTWVADELILESRPAVPAK